MTITDLIWFSPNEFQNIAFENTNAFGFSESRLFQSFIVEEKKQFLKKSCLVRSREIFSKYFRVSKKISGVWWRG